MERGLPDVLCSWMLGRGWELGLLRLEIGWLWPRFSTSEADFLRENGLGPEPVFPADSSGPRRAEILLGILGALRSRLRDAFPREAAAGVFDGWSWPPSGFSDDDGVLPGVGSGSPLPEYALRWLEQLRAGDGFVHDGFVHDGFVGDAERSVAAVRVAHLFALLAVRMSEPGSASDMGDPTRRLFHPRFWRLAGWLDDIWSNRFGDFQRAPALPETFFAASPTESPGISTEIRLRAGRIVRDALRDEASSRRPFQFLPIASAWRLVDFHTVYLEEKTSRLHLVIAGNVVEPSTKIVLCPLPDVGDATLSIEVTARVARASLASSVPYVARLSLRPGRHIRRVRIVGATRRRELLLSTAAAFPAAD